MPETERSESTQTLIAASPRSGWKYLPSYYTKNSLGTRNLIEFHRILGFSDNCPYRKFALL